MRITAGNFTRSIGFLAVFAAVAACGSGGSGDGSSAATDPLGTGPAVSEVASTDGPASTEASTTTPEVTAPTIALQTADDQTATAVVGAEGGTLTATSGAVTYTLVVPAEAVGSPVEMTMTPIASMGDSLDGGSMGGGVVFGPEGMLLASPATLTITGGAAADGALAFGFDGSGEEFHLVPFLPGTGIVLPVRHFSGVAYATVPAELQARMESAQVADSLDHWEQSIAAYLGAYTATYGDAGDPDVATRMDEFATDGAKLVADALAAAGADPVTLAASAIYETMAVYRELALLGLSVEGFPWDAIFNLLDKWDAALDAACHDASADPVAIVNQIMANERMRALVGHSTQTGAQLMERIDKCRGKYSAAVDIGYRAVNEVYAGSGSPEFTDFVLSAPDTELTLEFTTPTVCADAAAPGQAPNIVCGPGPKEWRWKGSVPLAVSNFTTNDGCWNGAPPVLYPGFEPALDIELAPDLSVVRPLAPANTHVKPAPPTALSVVLALKNGMDYAWVPSEQCQGSDFEGVRLADGWAAVFGDTPVTTGFGTTTVTWTRQSPPGSTPVGNGGYYAIDTAVTLTAASY